jgi:hypothetical protein
MGEKLSPESEVDPHITHLMEDRGWLVVRDLKREWVNVLTRLEHRVSISS